jgi:hypothetical protein
MRLKPPCALLDCHCGVVAAKLFDQRPKRLLEAVLGHRLVSQLLDFGIACHRLSVP